jgi:hypothetical protein
MEIEFQNKNQVAIADLLWQAQDRTTVDMILATFGNDAQLVYQMIIAASFDEVDDTQVAGEILSNIFNK